MLSEGQVAGRPTAKEFIPSSSGRALNLFNLTGFFLALLVLSSSVRAQRTIVTPGETGIVRLEIVPHSVLLDGPQARQRLLVNGYRRDGSVEDVTEQARFDSSNGSVARVDGAGVAMPVREGRTMLTALVGGLTTTVGVEARNTRRPVVWSFENQVESVLSKQGCNQGICHGAGSGKGGFRLSLRAFDPQADYERLRYEGRGRRLSLAAPSESLLLKKPALEMTHFGGLRLKRGSLEYRVISGWIAAGAPAPKSDTPKIVALEVYPKERALLPPASPNRKSKIENRKLTQRLLVTARFSDGHAEDVTHWAKYSSNEETIATVDESGKVTMRSVGETAISVWYLGQVAFARLSVPFPNRIEAVQYKSLPRGNPIDDRIRAKLAQLHLWPSALCTDAEFIRRVTLDALGLLPSPNEVDRFVSDPAPDKRTKLIETLLARPEFVDVWTYRWCDLLRVNRDTLGDKGMWSLYLWVRDSVATNKPWNQFAREILTAQGTAAQIGPVNFYRMGSKPEEFSETVSQVFLGIRVQCAHCHNHPFEKWTQNDYFRMANLFARVGKKGKDNNETIYAASSGDLNHPKLGHPLPPAAFDGPSLALDAPGDRRAFLADWMTSPDNPYFARSLVNRVWKRFMGRGLVEPVDDMRLTNPASNELLLAWLTQDFIARGYDIKRLIREILTSRAYQTSSQPNATNLADDRFYSHFLPHRLSAETLLDALCQATEQPETYPGMPAGTRAVALPDTRIASSFLDTFGRPPRQVTCECERNSEVNIAQALHFLNAGTLNAKITAKGGLLHRLMEANHSDTETANELYRICLSRLPSKSESKAVQDALTAAYSMQNPSQAANAPTLPAAPAASKETPAEKKKTVRAQVFADLLWALLSGAEFQYNH